MARRGLSQRTMDIQFLRKILLPVHYRHEFARRNDDVACEAKKVMERFPMTSDLLAAGSSFFEWIHGESITLADSLMDEWMQEPDAKKKSAMSEALGRFMTDRHAIPTLSPRPFLPREMLGDKPDSNLPGNGSTEGQRTEQIAIRLYAIWRSLIGFERFLMAEGMTDAPCLMPVVPINRFHGAEGIHDVRPDRLPNILEQRLLVALDSSLPLKNLDANMEMLLGHLDVLDRMGRKKRTPKGGSSERMPWTSFELYLQVLDFIKGEAPTKDEKELTLDFHRKMKWPVKTEDELTLALRNFRRWEKQSNIWMDAYSKIT